MFFHYQRKAIAYSVCIAMLLAGLAGSACAVVYHVDGSFQGENPTGESWFSAFPSIQQAIDAAADAGGGEVWIKAGVYQPEGLGRNLSIILKPNVSLYGGFRGNETDRADRNPKANRTVLSGDIGRIGSASDNCYHVLVAAENCRIDGFIISRGNADSAAEHRFGGGLRIPSGVNGTVIANCTFEKNNAEIGGAIHADGAELSITNCTFFSNSAETGGALATAGKTTLRIEDSIFSSNFAPGKGGALSLAPLADVHLKKTFFLYNSTDGDGGALYASTEDGQPLEIQAEACNFNENSARVTGGAAAFEGHFAPQLSDCLFEQNFSPRGAGAIANSGGVALILQNASFAKNRGTKGSENIGNDERSRVVQSADEAAKFVQHLKPAVPDTATQVVEPAPAPKPNRTLADVYVHNLQDIKVKLRSIVAGADYTVLVLGDLTDPGFIEHYRTIEAAARDYAPKGVQFSYIYRFLAHPENNSYLQPFHQKERARQAQLARETFSTAVPWLYDVMDNQTAEALAADTNHQVFLFSSDGEEIYAGSIDEDEKLRQALVKAVGPVEAPTLPDTLPEPGIEPVNMPESMLVERVNVNTKVENFIPLQITPLESRQPHYVKLRAEGNTALLESEKGKLYIGFHIDPLYQVEWNNLGEPLKYAIKTPEGVIAPSINSAPRVTQQATDSEPREFLLEARKLDRSQPLTLQVVYSVHSPRSKSNVEVQQQYLIYLAKDPFGGKVIGRQAEADTVMAEQKKADDSNAYNQLLIRFDFNRDGQLVKTETIGKLLQLFDKIDTDGDGILEEEEYLNYRKNR